MAQWLAVGLVSAWDLHLAVKLRNTLPFEEMNPIGQLLIYFDGNDVSLLSLYKFAGTVLVLGAFVLLYERMGSRVHWIMTPIFLFQLGLLYYLQTF
jgi:hypothetical protein